VVALKVPCAIGPETLLDRSTCTACTGINERADTLSRAEPGKFSRERGGWVTEQAPRGEPTGRTDRTVLDEVETRLGFRAFFAKHAWLDLTYRIVVGVVGAAVVVLGFVLIPLPGPGWLIVFGGLAILATEFVWAERLLGFARRKVHGWTEWVKAQSLLVRGLIGLLGLVCVAGAMAAYAALYGVPGWLPFL
jgi:uncharacterized protein (TIGR02611 family)